MGTKRSWTPVEDADSDAAMDEYAMAMFWLGHAEALLETPAPLDMDEERYDRAVVWLQKLLQDVRDGNDLGARFYAMQRAK